MGTVGVILMPMKQPKQGCGGLFPMRVLFLMRSTAGMTVGGGGVVFGGVNVRNTISRSKGCGGWSGIVHRRGHRGPLR